MSFSKGGTYTGAWGIGLYRGNMSVGTVNVNTGRVTITDTPERAYFYMPQASYDDGLTIELDNIQLELSSTATDYEPYQGGTYDITFPTEAGTVYGGTLNVISGELTVDRYFKSFTTLVGKQESADGYFWYSTTDALGIPAISGLNAKLISNRLKTEQNVSQTSFNGILTIYANGIIRWKEQGSLTLAEYRTYLANNPLEICYELATPITYALTPQEIRTLLGTNNIWADAGPISVEYTADTKMYIDSQTRATRSLIAGIETTMTASRAYTAGDLLIVGDTLYKAAASIASGATLTPGTNVTPTTVAEQLILLANA